MVISTYFQRDLDTSIRYNPGELIKELMKELGLYLDHLQEIVETIHFLAKHCCQRI